MVAFVNVFIPKGLFAGTPNTRDRKWIVSGREELRAVTGKRLIAGAIVPSTPGRTEQISSMFYFNRCVKGRRALRSSIRRKSGLAHFCDISSVELNGAENPSNDNERQALRSHEEWQQLYNYLKQKLGDLNLYWQVFDPTKNNEAIHGSLADDIADIYFDLKEGFGLRQKHQTQPEKSIWCWRFGFYSHWGKHAMDALRTIHSILEDANLGTE